MKAITIAAAAALSLLAIRAVHAGEGNGEPFALRAPGVAATATPAFAADTGSAAYPDLAGRPSWAVATDSLDALPATGSEGTVQTANSLPRGAMDGTAAYAQAQSARRFLAQQPAPPSRTARTAQAWSGKLGGW